MALTMDFTVDLSFGPNRLEDTELVLRPENDGASLSELPVV